MSSGHYYLSLLMHGWDVDETSVMVRNDNHNRSNFLVHDVLDNPSITKGVYLVAKWLKA